VSLLTTFLTHSWILLSIFQYVTFARLWLAIASRRWQCRAFTRITKLFESCRFRILRRVTLFVCFSLIIGV